VELPGFNNSSKGPYSVNGRRKLLFNFHCLTGLLKTFLCSDLVDFEVLLRSLTAVVTEDI
jgi:hypothetical protein